MRDQANMTIAREVIYKSDEIGGTMPCPHIHWATDIIHSLGHRYQSILAAKE